MLKIKQRIKKHEKAPDVKEWYQRKIKRLDIATSVLLVLISAIYISVFVIYLIEEDYFDR